MGGYELGEGDAALEGVSDQGTDQLVRLPEGHAFLNQPFGQVGGGRARRVGGPGHGLRIERRRGDEPGHGGQRPLDLVKRIEEGLLVLLQVAVVGERQPFQSGQEA